jgi:uncharacterized protein with FMN-binding domain
MIPPRRPYTVAHMRTKAPHHLLALSSAAVMAIYGAGFLRTRAAAAKFSDAPAMRRPVAVMPPSTGVALAAPVAQVAPMSAPQISVDAPVASDRRAPAVTAPTREDALTPAPMVAASAPTATSQTTASLPAAASAAPATSAATTAVAPAAATTPAPAADAATTPLPAADTPAAPATPRKYKDGVYLGYGTSRHGDIQAQVVIADDRIISASISKCLTQYSCDWIAPLVPQVVKRQSAEVDYVSGATQSTNAFYYAVLEALSIARNR